MLSPILNIGTTNTFPIWAYFTKIEYCTILSVSMQVDQQDICRETIRPCCRVGLEAGEKFMYSLGLHMDFLHHGVWAGPFRRHVGLVLSSVCGYKLVIYDINLGAAVTLDDSVFIFQMATPVDSCHLLLM